MEQEKTVDVLWTGGWDSTFRLLQLILSEKKRVKPHYLIDPDRPSVKNEKEAMDRIRQSLYKKFPHTKELLLPTDYTNVADVEPDAEITQAYNEILKTHHLGSQYDWLARYCKEKNISNLELGILGLSSKSGNLLFATANYNNKSHFSFDRIISTKAKEKKPDKSLCSKGEYILFKYFSTPLFHKTKKELGSRAQEFGAKDLMNMTWFCHRPLFGKHPCGRCNPCSDAINEGFKNRVGLLGLMINIATKYLKLRALAKLLKKLRLRL